MQHSDGTTSIQQFENELGVKARVRFTGGAEATVYSRYSCLNNLRALNVAEITQQPTFTEESRVEQTANSTVTTDFQPEEVPTEINVAPAPAVENPVAPVPEVVPAPAVPAEVQTSEPESVPSDDDPVVTAEINGVKITARLSALKQLIK